MKNLFKANSEYMATPKQLKPFLCKNTNGLYFVSVFFSKEHIESRGIEIIK